MVKVIVGYNVMPGISGEEYERWLRDVHIPDLSKVPGLRKVVLNTVKGTTSIPGLRKYAPNNIKGAVAEFEDLYRIVELHYDSIEECEKALKWREREENLVSKERTAVGKTDVKFYFVCETEEVDLSK
jgi:hypothetical protein